MHLRRALLLFAIVLGVAAIAASLAPPPDREGAPARTETEAAPPAQPREDGARPAGGEAVRLDFDATASRPVERRVERGRHVIVTVSAREPGEVRIASLGRTDFASPRTPAVFDLLLTAPGRHEITFIPPAGAPRPVGALVVSR
jgi:hypothetical protein